MSSLKRKTRKPRQASFFDDKPALRFFGGALLNKSNPKIARPLSKKEPIHLVLKSARAFGPSSMLQKYNVTKIDSLIRNQAKLNNVKIYRFVNVGNHLHLVIKLEDPKLFAKFIRAVTGLIARHVLKRERGPGISSAEEFSIPKKASPQDQAMHKKNQFWVARPFTRLIAWGRDYNYVSGYMDKNQNQANGQTNKGSFVAWGFDFTDPKMIRAMNTG